MMTESSKSKYDKSQGVRQAMKFELINEPLKVKRTSIFGDSEAILVDLEDTMVIINQKSKLFPVVHIRTGKRVGFFVVEEIYLAADTIVNTAKGAVGEPLEKHSTAGFIKSESFDLSNTKEITISEKEFREIERKAYHYLDKLEEGSYLERSSSYSFNFHRHQSLNNLEELDFFAYLFEPEEFLLLKEEEKIIVIAKEKRNVIVCDKKKRTYINVSKENGVQIFGQDGKEVYVGSAGGVVIGGQRLKDIIGKALRPFFHNVFNEK
ncbi:MAG: hypothetical protein GF308_12130 [Candidatus Heimdallarchaeota archaeon]|nr:hypothetical protein [Candidatus Heimdallarchaeota archaeon]